MATEAVQQWITRDMKLSQVVTSFETDFSNGYLFGEILNRYQLVDDMSTFLKKSNKETKVKNFQQVEAVMRNLKVKFDGKLVHQIMNEERGAALRLLFQLKLAIERNVDDPTHSGLKETMTGLKPTKVMKHLQEVEKIKKEVVPDFGTQTKLVGQKTIKLGEPLVHSFNGYKKTAGLHNKMEIFDYRKRMLEEKAAHDQKAEEDLIFQMQQDARELERTKLEENKEFMNQWMAEGHKNWKKNQQKRSDAIARVKYFEDREVKAYKDKLEFELNQATKELHGGIYEFDQNLQKLGIEKNTNFDEAVKRMEEKKGIPPGQIQNFSYAATMNKIKEKKNVLDFAVKERDRRRRKMLVDQAKTQSELDRKRNEELLIEKLLKQQSEEHQFAYLERRGIECKQLVVDQRRIKAESYEERKKAQIEELERKRNEGMAEQIKKHREDLGEKKRDHQALRREEKAKRRGLNIEICSEVLDLILDIANEAYDETHKKGSNGKLDKPMWREWMRYFKDNQVTSRARKGLLNGQQDSAFTMMNVTGDQSQFITEEQFDILDDPKKSLDQIIEAMKYDSAYEDMLQYLGISGIFNITQGDFKEWFDIKTLLQQSGMGVDSTVIESLIPRQNPTLGRMLHTLLKEPSEESKTTEPVYATGIPHHLTLKLVLLGRACAGKRTVAKQIQEQYPAGKVKVFRMDDLIKEVIEYINPKPQADAAAAPDKGKKPPPAKGKVEDTGPVDPYAGMDTKEYKEIGHQIKKFIGDGDLTLAGPDLTAYVTDETLLVNLFIQKLKLTFPHDKSEQAKIEEIKANILKEKEILEQLAELEAANAGADPKAKGKAPPAKGKGAGGPSGEEQLRADLELATKVQPEGWILIDFPRSLEQAKTMERLMNNGFTCMIDRPKDQVQKEFEAWSKFVSPASSIAQGQELAFNGEPFIYPSATDAYLFLTVPSDECIRRVSNRKIDPTTNTVYHMEDNPPPEGDAKLRDRLQDYEGEKDQDRHRVLANHSEFDKQAEGIKRWASSFGVKDELINQSLSSLLEVRVGEDTKPKKEEVIEMVQKTVGAIIAFKQAQYEHKKSKVKEQMEALAAGGEQPEGGAPESNTEQVPPGTAEAAAELQPDPSRQVIQSSHHQTHYSKQSTTGLHPAFSVGGGKSLDGLKRSSKSIVTLNEEGKRQLWKQFQGDYYRDCLKVFKAIRRQRSQVFEGLTQMQSSFIDTYLGRQDSSLTILIQDFIESFNKFSQEFPNLRSDQHTQIELNKRVTRLSNDIWSVLESKKDQALLQHNKLNTDGWVVNEMKKLMKNACRVIQAELSRFFVALSLVSGIDQQVEVDLERTLDNYNDDGVKTIDDNEHSPLFDKLFGYLFRIVQQKAEIISGQADESKREMLKNELDLMIYRVNLIRTWVMLKVKEFNQFWRQLYEVLDEAIITAIRLENDATQSVVQNIKAHMQEQAMTGKFNPMNYDDFRIPYVDLDQYVQRMDFSGAEVPLYMQNITVPDDPVMDMRLTLSMLNNFYTDFRFHSYEEYLDGSTFIHSILLAFQTQGKVPSRWRYYDFTIFNQMIQKVVIVPPGLKLDRDGFNVEQRELINWKAMVTMFALIMSPMADSETLDQYEEALLQVGEVLHSADQLAQVPAWFDDFEVIIENPIAINMQPTNDSDEDEEEAANRNKDFERLASIKHLLFKIYQTNTKVLKVKDFVNSLRELTQIAQGCPNFHSFLFGE